MYVLRGWILEFEPLLAQNKDDTKPKQKPNSNKNKQQILLFVFRTSLSQWEKTSDRMGKNISLHLSTKLKVAEYIYYMICLGPAVSMFIMVHSYE